MITFIVGPAARFRGPFYIQGMSCPSWQWHRTGSSWSPVRILPVAPLWCDLGFAPNSRDNKAAANLRPTSLLHYYYIVITQLLFHYYKREIM